MLEFEAMVLKSLQSSPIVCRYLHHGRLEEERDNIVFLVMELLQESMSQIRSLPETHSNFGGVPCSLVRTVALEMLDGIEMFHNAGFVHRDIKASNFVQNASVKHPKYYIIDFGLARRHLDKVSGEVVPARGPHVEFRGTSMYASLASHRGQELGRKDDLWSWLYLIVDFLRGDLPWTADAHGRDRSTVAQLKVYYTDVAPQDLVWELPGKHVLLEIMRVLSQLEYAHKPDYDQLRRWIQQLGGGGGGSSNPETNQKEEQDPFQVWKAECDSENIDWTSRPKEYVTRWSEMAKRAISEGSSSRRSWVKACLDEISSVDYFLLESQNVFETELEWLDVQSLVCQMEHVLERVHAVDVPPAIQSFGQKRKQDQIHRGISNKKRKKHDWDIRRHTLGLGNPKKPTKTLVPGHPPAPQNHIVNPDTSGFSSPHSTTTLHQEKPYRPTFPTTVEKSVELSRSSSSSIETQVPRSSSLRR